MRKHRLTFVGQDETIAGALEQHQPDRFFERAEPPAHGRLRLFQATGGRSKRALSSDREEDGQIVPFKSAHRVTHTFSHAFRAIFMMVMQLS